MQNQGEEIGVDDITDSHTEDDRIAQVFIGAAGRLQLIIDHHSVER